MMHTRPRKARKWESDRIYVTRLAAAARAPNECCRVCSRSLAVGDIVLARAWHGGFSCATCGWMTLSDLEWEPAWRAALGQEPMASEQAQWLRCMGLVELDAATRRMTWTDVGKRLRDEAKAAASKAAPSGSESGNHVGSCLHPDDVALGAGGRR